MANTSDVIIIGAGVIGCGTAYYLAEKGVSVTVLEAGPSIGEGGSARNGGGVRQSGRDPRELPMVMWGIQNEWPTLTERLGVDCEYVQGGNLRLGRNEADQTTLQKLTDRAVAAGLDVKMISGDEAREINPYLSKEVYCASWCPTDGHANPLQTTLAYYLKSRSMGVKYVTSAPAVKLGMEKGILRQVVTPQGTFEGKTIIVAAGIQSNPLLKQVGIRVPMLRHKAEAVVTEAEPVLFPQMLGAARSDFYGHQTKHGSFVFGGFTGHEFFEDFSTEAMERVSTAHGLGATCRGVIGYFPAMKNFKVVRTWAGVIDICQDGIPVISWCEEVPGLFIACAFTGHGFGIAPGAAYNIAQMVTGEETTVDVTPFRYDRFQTIF